MTKLSDTQHILLCGAVQRESRSVLPLPSTITPGGGTSKAMAALLRNGFVDERETAAPEIVARTDGDIAYGLFITSAGAAAVGIDLAGSSTGQDAPDATTPYILSQASEGWSALPEVYDDGGLSGGTLERSAFKRLLAEVAAGRVDIIVVYNVDRLTHSLFDFAKLVETFDAAGASFVSVTQSFNTTTSMGRLTLNMLFSFAQFEREVTAERIPDKIAASKARGMWMGGTPPLGSRPTGAVSSSSRTMPP